MINGIKPTVSNTTKTEKTTTKNGLSFDEAMNVLLDNIQKDYAKLGMTHKTSLELNTTGMLSSVTILTKLLIALL